MLTYSIILFLFLRVLRNYFQAQRAADIQNAARTTIRLLESLIRLSEAHARLMYHDEVTILDAVVAVCVVEASMHNTALFGCHMNPLHTAFPDVSAILCIRDFR